MTTLKELAECYGKLYDRVKAETNDPLENLARFFPVEGKHYRDNPKVRFMVVGKCTNGWWGINGSNRAEFVNEAEECIGKTGFGFWLDENGSSIKKEGKEYYPYSINRPPFWHANKDALLSQNEMARDKSDWFEYLVWCNLYPFSPRHKWNTTEEQKNAQSDKLCQELLQKEIEYFKPTHILFHTCWEDWFDHVAPLFGNAVKNKHISNKGVIRPSDLICVEGAGIWNSVKIVVTIRADGQYLKTDENGMTVLKKFASDVRDAFASLK